jgi:hypothetical protein
MFRPRAHTLPEASLDQLTGERKRRLVFVNSFTRVAAISLLDQSGGLTFCWLFRGDRFQASIRAASWRRPWRELPTNLGDARPSKAAPKPAGRKPKKSSSRPSDKEVERKAAVAHEREQKSDRD